METSSNPSALSNAAIADQLNGHAAVLDSEIVSLDNEGKSQFYELLFHRGEARVCAFDLLWCNGEDLRNTSLMERKRRLRLLIQESDRLFYCDHVERHGKSLFQLACEHDLEGIVAKHKSDPYTPSTKWLKIRNQQYSQWAGRDELFERERETDPDTLWDACAMVCEDAA